MSKFIYFFLIIVVGALVWGRVTKKEAPTPTKINHTVQPAKPLPKSVATPDPLLDLINNQRAKKLVETVEMDIAAQKKCVDMETRNYWAHSINNEPFSKFNPPSALMGENLAKGYTTDRQIIDNWVASPAHYANIIEPRYAVIGVARCDGPQHLLIVTEFGSYNEN